MSDAPASPPQPSDASASWLRWAPVLVVAVAWIAHESVRHNGWVLEDARLVRDNTDVARGPAAVAGLLAGGWAPSETASGPYGPLAQASFAIEAPLWRSADGALSPGGFHLTNLLLHGLCALLLLRLLAVLMPRRPVVAVVGAVLFAAHPLHAGTVGPLMGRGELLALLLSLLAALAWRAYGGRHATWLPLAALCWLLALLSKEIAIGLPLVLVLLDRALPPEGRKAAGWQYAAACAVFIVPLAIFAATWGGAGATTTDLPAQGAGARLLIGLEGLGRMLLSVLVPVGLRGDHTDEAGPEVGYPLDGAALGLMLFVAALTVWVLVRAWRGRASAFDVVWLALIALVVPAALLARTGAPLETRFAYLTVLPAFAAAGIVFEGLAMRSGRLEAFGVARAAMVAGVGVACLIGLSHREARAWQDDEAFHERLLDRNPQHVRAMIRLAATQRKSATELRAHASGLRAEDPRRERLHEQRREALDQSLAWARRAVRHEQGRRSSDAWRELGFAELADDHSAQALRALDRARQLDPVLRAPPGELAQRYPAERVHAAAEVYHAIGRATEALGEREAAADAYHTATQLHPERLDYLERAGMNLCRVNQYAEGLRLLNEALRRTNDRKGRVRLEEAIDNARKSARRIARAHLREGRSAEGKGKYRDAVKHYERATEVNPTLVEAHIQAGWLRGWWFGNYEVAEARFAHAERLLREGVRRGGIREDDDRFAEIQRRRRELAEQQAKEEAEEDDAGGEGDGR